MNTVKKLMRSFFVYIVIGCLLFSYGAQTAFAAGYSSYIGENSLTSAEQAVVVPLSEFTSADGSSYLNKIDDKPVGIGSRITAENTSTAAMRRSVRIFFRFFRFDTKKTIPPNPTNASMII